MRKSQRPSHTKNIPLEKIARGIITRSSEILFEAKLSKKREYFFRKSDASFYKKPNLGANIRCIYNGNKRNLFPHEIYDMKWNLLWREK